MYLQVENGRPSGWTRTGESVTSGITPLAQPVVHPGAATRTAESTQPGQNIHNRGAAQTPEAVPTARGEMRTPTMARDQQMQGGMRAPAHIAPEIRGGVGTPAAEIGRDLLIEGALADTLPQVGGAWIPVQPELEVGVGMPIVVGEQQMQGGRPPVQMTHARPPVTPPPTLPNPGECGFCLTLAMGYVPSQEWRMIYTPEDGFSRGTIFEELDMPFVGKGDCRYE